jgi:magnesium-protoporphyrin O-methyltransferase
MPQSTCCRVDYDEMFGADDARDDLAAYRRDGPSRSTRTLLESLIAEGVSGMTLLDIGGGVGAVQHELLAAGAATSVDVDLSHAYLAAAREEAERRGLADREAHRYGNFAEIADDVDGADIVTLDRVICCYPDMRALVGASAARAGQLYGLVYPVDRWWIRLSARVVNAGLWAGRRSFRIHIHGTAAVDALVRSAGLQPRAHRRGIIWQAVVYRRAEAAG